MEGRSGPIDLARSAWSVAEFNVIDSPLRAAIASSARPLIAMSGLAAFGHSELAGIVWSIAELPCRNAPLRPSIAAQSLPRITATVVRTVIGTLCMVFRASCHPATSVSFCACQVAGWRCDIVGRSPATSVAPAPMPPCSHCRCHLLPRMVPNSSDRDNAGVI
eukprot:NODE_22465_length_707_cov_1.541379.p1 GENE.NODE_22465_length_707_cov_1.541379~~NODE_22465_length_707_cov_1.541379.p1  ORF type:complete len:181 (-),score=13.26 NODE_22465_length_707_cov_1.541379:165-653(-)